MNIIIHEFRLRPRPLGGLPSSLEDRRAPVRLGALLVAILVAGVLAGLLAASFHVAATEPIMDGAVKLEEMRTTGEADSAPAVSHGVRLVGFFAGWLALGLTHAGLLGGTYAIARIRGWLGPHWFGAFLLAVAAYAAFALLPALTYSANPPGVGNHNTIGVSQEVFIACLVLAILGAGIALVTASRLPLPGLQKAAMGAFFLAPLLFGLYLVLLPNPDLMTIPAELSSTLRIRSVEGLTIFWAVLGVTFAAFATRINEGASRGR